MKSKPILFSAVVLSILLEVLLAVLVYNKIGSGRLPYQFGRVAFQLVFISMLFTNWFRIGLFLLSGFHLFSGLFILFYYDNLELSSYVTGGYHVLIGIVIYFHDWLEDMLLKR